LAQVTITINGRDYDVACDDGEEERLIKLGATLNDRIKKIITVSGQIDDSRLLVMAALLLADELSDVYSELDEVRASDALANSDETISLNIEEATKRIEIIAERIEQA
jgi:cell division protein ZapA